MPSFPGREAGGGTGPDSQAGLEGPGDWRTEAPRRRPSGEAWEPSPSSPSSPFHPGALLPSPRLQIHLHVSGSHTRVPSTYCPGSTFPWMSTTASTTSLPKEISLLPTSNLLLVHFSPTQAKTKPNLLKRPAGSAPITRVPCTHPPPFPLLDKRSTPHPSSHLDPARLPGASLTSLLSPAVYSPH